MDERCYVYNPADPDYAELFGKPVGFTYNSRDFVLEPNAINEIVSPWGTIPSAVLATKCLEVLGPLGVFEVRTNDPADLETAPLIERAEKVHADYLRRTLGRVVMEFDASRREHEAHGLVPPEETDAIRKAKAKLVEWGLMAGPAVPVGEPGKQ